MKTQATRQEIILVTYSSLGKLSFCRIKDEQPDSNSSAEKLEKACWDGLLPDLLPGIVETNCFLWKIVSAEKFICISLGPDPEPVQPETTINPFSLLRHSSLN